MQLEPTHSSNRINKLAQALAAKSYLEVGVCKGPTFVNVAIAHKDAVDPEFQFDYQAIASDKVRFFPIPSDEFFTDHAEASYDIIFLDGLHTFEQTFRDFCSSMSFAHRRTVWLIDDTRPNDVFSAHRDAHTAFQVREQHGTKNQSWHGDVYKVVPAIHDFFPQLSFLTLSRANPQTLVWFEPRRDFAPRFNSLEAIERLDYFDYLGLDELFNLYRDEDEGIARVLAGLGRTPATATRSRWFGGR